MPEEHHTKADHIEKAGEHVIKLIDDVLDLSIIEAGKLRLSPEPIKAGEIVQESVHLISPQLNDKGQGLAVEESGLGDELIYGDRLRVRQIILNILSNAVKYNEPNGSIDISYERQQNQLKILVADTGQGLSTQQLKVLFEPYERAGAEKSNILGKGMGLAISKRLAELMGGEIGVESEEGKGSCFWLTLPLVDS